MPLNESGRCTCLALLALLLTQCQDERSAAPVEEPQGTDRIAAFEAWRRDQPRVETVTVYGFLAEDWYHRDGRIHYFVSELHEFEIPREDAPNAVEGEAAERLAAEFRRSVTALVGNWPDRPKVGKDFGERVFTTDRDAAEAKHNDYLAHRHNDAIELHRVWLR